MKALVDRIHAAGLKAQLWWAPLGADPGSRTDREHPDWLLRNADGTARKITWWDANYLCPAHGPVRDDARALAVKALGDWGFDGLKIDGQHLNGAPPCYNAAHHHAAPEDSVEGVPGFFKAIWDAAIETKPERGRRDLPVRHRATRSSRCPTSTWRWRPIRRARGRCGSRARRSRRCWAMASPTSAITWR